MNPFSGPDSLSALKSMCPLKSNSTSPSFESNAQFSRQPNTYISFSFTDPDEKNSKSTQLYGDEFQCMVEKLKEGDCMGEGNAAAATEKKRRLSIHQAQALEKNFEAENKLEPETKAKLAQELGLQPRQVAVWFQNRRARWKTKQLERDYAFLKASYDSLRLDFGALERDREALNAELRELQGKLPGENAERSYSVKEGSPLFSDSENNTASEQSKVSGSGPTGVPGSEEGPSESNSSGILKDESGMKWFQIEEKGFQPQFVKMEEQGIYSSTEETCNFFSVDQAPTLHWH